nr:Ger(x)C family spore germination protein [Ectobacillus panaciterrae]
MIVIIIVLFGCLTGCWSRKELNELGIAVGMGIDKEEDHYVVTYQVVNPGEIAAQQGGGGRSPITTYQQKADTIFEATRKITTESSRKIYIAHLKMLVIGQDLAEEGIGEVLDYLSRENQFRTDFYIVVAKETKAEEILSVLTASEKIPANKLFASLETSEKAWAPTKTVVLDELISKITSKGIEPTISGIKRIGKKDDRGAKMKHVQQLKPEIHLTYMGIAAFKEDRMVGWLNERESKGFNYLMGNVKNTIDHVPCSKEKKGKELAIEIFRTKSDLKGSLKRGNPQIQANLFVEGNIGEVQCAKLDLSKPESIDQLEKAAEQKIKKMVHEALQKGQKKYKADIFGFGEVIQRSEPAYWEKMKKNWSQTFVELPVNVQVDVKLRHTGSVGDSFLKETKE